MIRRFARRQAGIPAISGLTAIILACPAHAAGSNMPWEQPLQQILQSIEGPVAKIMAVIIIIITGLTLAFGDSSGGFRRLVQIVFGLSIAFAASSSFAGICVTRPSSDAEGARMFSLAEYRNKAQSLADFLPWAALIAPGVILNKDGSFQRTARFRAPVEVVELPKPLPLPGQLKPLPGRGSKPEPRDPRQRVDTANAAARVQPTRSGYINAIQLYPYTEGALYQVYAAPGQVTDIALQEGEQLVGSGPIAAGDTARWIIGDAESGTNNAKRIHILVKPTRPDLLTNLVINTDRRTYHLELRSTEKTYMASVSWHYPHDRLMALRQRNIVAQSVTPVATGLEIDNLRFRYAIDGDHPPWRPLRAFDDGRKVYIAFPRGISQGEMPPLFIIGPAGNTSELVNYRVRGNHMIVDRLFAAAELRLGDGNSERRVRIVRVDGRALW